MKSFQDKSHAQLPKHIFISYRYTEAEFALKLATDLRNAGVFIWMDRLDAIRGADDWRRSIEHGLRNAAALIAVLSPDYINSKYCLRELATADELDIPILPILLRNVPVDEHPMAIRRLQCVDFQHWRDSDTYIQQLEELLTVVQQKALSQIGNVPDAETRYLNRLIADLESRRGVLEYIELSGETEVDDTRPKLYLDVEDEFGFSELIQKPNQAQAKETVKLGNIRDALEKHSRFVLIGEPGSSKTTTIRRLALEAARSRIIDPKAPLPLLLYLPSWGSQQTLEGFVSAQWREAELPIHVDPMVLLNAGDIMLYLDGLNELGGQAKEKAIQLSRWFNFPVGPQRVIVTCRKDDYLGNFDLNIPIVQIDPMDDHHIRQFVKSYLSAKSEDLLKRILPSGEPVIQNKRHLYHLARNLYMLSALIIVYDTSSNEELRQNNGMLFQMLVRALAKREAQRYSPGWLPHEERFPVIENALAKLAFAMIEEEAGTQVSREYAMRFLDEDTLQSAQSAHYVEIYGDNVQFYHQLLQEYFAAVELKSVGLSHVLLPTEYEDAGFMFSNPIEKKWDQVILAFAGIERKDAVIREIQQYDPVLAASIIGSDINVSDALIDELIADQIERLGEEVANLKMGAVTALRHIGKITTPSLIEVLKKSNDPYARAGAALVLEKTADAAATSVLISRLTDTESAWFFGVMVCDYVENALKAIDSLEAKEALKNWAHMLLPHLDSEDVNVRGRAAMKLGRIGNSIAVPKLINLLNDKNYTDYWNHNERICDYAVEALEEIGTSEATRAVKEWRRQQTSDS